MKQLFKIFFGLILTVALFSSCDKAKDIAVFDNGSTPVVSSSVTTYAPTAADSNAKKIAFTWTDPKFASDPSTYRFVVEFDSASRNFANPQTRIVIGKLNDSVVAKEMNAILLNLGFKFNVPGTLQVRVKASYNNYNERYISAAINVTMTAYKIPPRVALPTSDKLFLVGNATQGGWNNPVPAPTQEFAKIDETTFGGVFQLNAASEFLVLPVNGDWGHKFSVSGTIPAAGGDFGYDLPNNFNGPASAGWYTITLDFQSGKFTVVPFTSVLPTNLFIVGNATSGGWNNPVPVPSQQLTRQNSSVWKITLPMVGGNEYLLLPVNGDWSHKYAIADNSLPGVSAGGTFGYDFSKNFPAPAANGTYTITANFATQKFTVQ